MSQHLRAGDCRISGQGMQSPGAACKDEPDMGL